MGSATTPTVVGAFSARNIVGDTTGTAVPASYIGQFISGSATANTGTGGTSNTFVDVAGCSIVLTAGCWLLGYNAMMTQSVLSHAVSCSIRTGGVALLNTAMAIQTIGVPEAYFPASVQVSVNISVPTTYVLSVRGSGANSGGIRFQQVSGGLTIPDCSTTIYAIRIA